MQNPTDDSSQFPFLTDELLEKSGVVANCRMNRERTLTGANGYSRELGFQPLDLLKHTAMSSGHSCWLDLCCGSANALIEAARNVHLDGLDDRIEIVGVDLVEMFSPLDPQIRCLRLIEASLTTWIPDRQFDVITCVHGLHYIGDKLGLVARAASWLTATGRFTASFSFENVKLQGGRQAGKKLIDELRRQGLKYDARRKRIECDGRQAIDLPLCYLGADDRPGPNYTGQAAVDSYYNWSK
jgi:SAM-dependent methyltransferase